MQNIDNVLRLSGVVFVFLLGASFMTNIIKHRLYRFAEESDLIYDPDRLANITSVCIFSKNLHATAYERSPCRNKTLIHWYNPWLRHGLWTGVWNGINARNRLEKVRLTEKRPIVNETEEEKAADPPAVAVPEKKKNPEPKAKNLEFIYSLLVGLLIVSVIFACWEVFKERLKKNEAAGAKSQGQGCTLADFTINRHRRRESQQQQQTAAHLPRQGSLESTAKVTQTLIHQSSLDRAFPKTISEVMKSMGARRSSVPTCLDGDAPGKSQSAGTKTTKRQSVDVTGEESSDARKKTRHLIRRH